MLLLFVNFVIVSIHPAKMFRLYADNYMYILYFYFNKMFSCFNIFYESNFIQKEYDIRCFVDRNTMNAPPSMNFPKYMCF